jgi:hypothetical protein
MLKSLLARTCLIQASTALDTRKPIGKNNLEDLKSYISKQSLDQKCPTIKLVQEVAGILWCLIRNSSVTMYVTFNGTAVRLQWFGCFSRFFLPLLYYLGITARNGSGDSSAVAYTARAMLQKTSSCVPLGCEKPMVPSLRKS